MDSATGHPLTDRVREALDDERPMTEKRMFGGVCFMVRGKMALGVMSDGALLVRVDPARSDELLARQGTQQAEMGKGRSMGPSWLTVAPASVGSDAELGFWVDVAIAHNHTLVSAD